MYIFRYFITNMFLFYTGAIVVGVVTSVDFTSIDLPLLVCASIMVSLIGAFIQVVSDG